MSSDFESAVNKALPWFSGEYSRWSGSTSVGQRYIIVATKAVWYKVRLFLEEDHLDKHSLSEYHWCQHTSEEGVREQVDWIQRRLKREPILNISQLNTRTVNTTFFFSIIKLSDDCKSYPDKYLLPGDHVQITRKLGLYTHDAIYIGGKKVIHIFMDQGESKTAACAREDPWSKYVGYDEDGTVPWLGSVNVVVYRLRIRKADKIIEEAKQLCSSRHRCGDYNFIFQNCQHFASYCATGQEFSLGVHGLADRARQVGEALGKGPRPSTVLSRLYESPLDHDSKL